MTKLKFNSDRTTLFSALVNLVLLLGLFLSPNFLIGQNRTTETTKPKAEMNVLVTDFENNSLEGEQIWFIGKETKAIFKGVSNSEGKFTVNLKSGDTYEIQIKSIGEAQVYNTIKIPSIGPDEFFPSSQLSIKVEPATEFTLDNVYFDSGKWSLKTESKKELDELYDFMKYKKGVKVEIGGHTDNVGKKDANKTLSQKRADAVRQYILEKGISPSRIRARGYGEDVPRDTNNTPAGRAKNRRTEVKVFGK